MTFKSSDEQHVLMGSFSWPERCHHVSIFYNATSTIGNRHIGLRVALGAARVPRLLLCDIARVMI